MADSKISINKTLKFEGGYVNDPSDDGGETFAGISRKFHPDWIGWSILDKTEDKNSLLKDIEFMSHVQDWYKENYWDKVQGDNILSQDVANNIFDLGVNSGTKRAIKYAQIVSKAKVDGIFGKNTLNAINSMNPDDFVKAYKGLRTDFYNKLVQRVPSNSKFLRGWLNRVNSI